MACAGFQLSNLFPGPIGCYQNIQNIELKVVWKQCVSMWKQRVAAQLCKQPSKQPSKKHALDKVLNLPCVVLTDMSNNLPNTHLKHICCELPLTFNGKMGFDPIDVTRTCRRSGNVLPRQGKPMEIHGNPWKSTSLWTPNEFKHTRNRRHWLYNQHQSRKDPNR